MNTVIASPFSKLPTSKQVWQMHKAVGWNAKFVASVADDVGDVPEDIGFDALIRHQNNRDLVNAERTQYYGNVVAWPLAQLAAAQVDEGDCILWLHENIVPNSVAPQLIQILKQSPSLAWVSAAPRTDGFGNIFDNSSRCVAWRAAALLQWTASFSLPEVTGHTTMDAVMNRMKLAGQEANYLWMNNLMVIG